MAVHRCQVELLLGLYDVEHGRLELADRRQLVCIADEDGPAPGAAQDGGHFLEKIPRDHRCLVDNDDGAGLERRLVLLLENLAAVTVRDRCQAEQTVNRTGVGARKPRGHVGCLVRRSGEVIVVSRSSDAQQGFAQYGCFTRTGRAGQADPAHVFIGKKSVDPFECGELVRRPGERRRVFSALGFGYVFEIKLVEVQHGRVFRLLLHRR